MSEPTFNGDLSPDQDLAETWQTVVLKLEERAHFKLDSEKPPSIDGIAALINPPKMPPTKVQQARDTVILTLKCLHGIAGMVSQVATVVFGPSEQIMNAVSFVVQVCQNVQDVFDNLTALMERLSVFLSRLSDYYQRKGYIDRGNSPKLEPAVRRGVYKVLENFVSIMALSYELGREWTGQESRGFKAKAQTFGKKVKVVFKVGAFGSDLGVKAAIAQFERSVLDVSDLQIDDIHRRMNDTALAVVDISADLHKVLAQGDKNAIVTEQLLVAAERQALDANHIIADLDHNTNMTKQLLSLAERNNNSTELSRRKEDAKTQLENLRKALSISEEDANLHHQSHQEFAGCLPGTGLWLLDHESFKIWARLQGLVFREGRLLSIQGAGGHGKSYLSHAIIEHLRTSSGKHTASQVYTAWHYFAPHEERRHTVLQAIKHVIFQLAQIDSGYMSFLRSLGPSALADDVALVNNLIGTYVDQSRASTTWFMILDGIDHAEPDDHNILDDLVTIVRRSSAAIEGVRVRLLLTGNRSAIEHAKFKVNGMWQVFELDNMDKLPQNDDLIRFLELQLSESPIFQNKDSMAKNELRREVQAKLLEIAHGDYNKLKRRLDDIVGADDIASVKEILRMAQEDDLFSMRSQIEELNKGKHIHALNIILAWMNVADVDLSASILRDIVQLTCGEESIAEPTDFLDKRCNKLVNVYVEEDRTHAVFKPEAQRALEDAKSKLVTVTPAEVNLVEKMLQRQFSTVFGDLDLYENFAFHTFFQQKRLESKQDELVHLPARSQCDVMVARHCLTVLCDILDGTRYEDLRWYAKKTIWLHVFGLRPDSIEDPAQRTEIGYKIYRLLSEPVLIDLWVSGVVMVEVLEDRSGCLSRVRDWLNDTAVRRAIRSQSTRTPWLPKQHSSSSRNADVLEQVARLALKKWYENPDAEGVEKSFAWLSLYFRITGPDHEEYKEESDDTEMTTDELAKWLIWARTELTLHGITLTEHRIMYAEAFAYSKIIQFGEYSTFQESDLAQLKAIQLCRQVLATMPNFWKATVLQAGLLISRGVFKRGLDMLLQLRTTHSALLDVDEDYTDCYWRDIMRPIAMISNIENYLDEAVISLAALIEHEMSKPPDKTNEDLTSLPAQYLAALYKSGEYKTALDFLVQCQNRYTSEGENWLGRLLRIGEADVHHQLLKFAYWINAYDQIDSYYQFALEERRQGKYTSLDSDFIDTLEIKRLWLRWRCRGHDMVVEGYEALLEKDGDNTSRDHAEAVKMLAQVLLQLLGQADLTIEQHDNYMHSLMALSQYCIRRKYAINESDSDATLALARAYHRQGKADLVRFTLFNSFNDALDVVRKHDDWHSESGWDRLAMSLPLVGDDEDALAVWAIRIPQLFLRDEDPDAEDAAETAALDNTTQDNPVASTASDAQGAAADAITDTDASSQDRPATTADQLEPNADPNGTGLPSLHGKLLLSCSGCDNLLDRAERIAYCRDCLGVFLCETCHRRLLGGRLPRQVCDANHDLLVIPAYDDKAWRTTVKGMVKVGDRVVPKEQWLDELEAKWQLDKGGKAARGINKFKMLWRSKRAMRQEADLANIAKSAAAVEADMEENAT